MLCVRLSRTSCLRAADHRRWPTPAPARCTMASISSRPARSIVPAAGSQRTARSPGCTGRRTTLVTSWPEPSRRANNADPIKPLEPVTATRIGPSLTSNCKLATGQVC